MMHSTDHFSAGHLSQMGAGKSQFILFERKFNLFYFLCGLLSRLMGGPRVHVVPASSIDPKDFLGIPKVKRRKKPMKRS